MWHHYSLYFILVLHVMTALLVIAAVFLRGIVVILERYKTLPLFMVRRLLRSVHAIFIISMVSVFLTGSYWVVHSGMGFHSAWLPVAYILSSVVVLCWWLMMRFSNHWSVGKLAVMHGVLLLLLFLIVREEVTQSTWFWS